MTDTNLSIKNTTKSRLTTSEATFTAIKDVVLGKKYTLSIAFVGNRVSQNLNSKYRKKNTPTNILSFALTKNEGEIVMDLTKIRKETKLFDRSFNNLVLFLFIHGLFHLKGMEHGGTMENKEASVRKRFNI